MPSAGELKGVQRAAVLLLSLGESDAAEVLRHMGPKDVQKVGTAMAELGDVSCEKATDVIDKLSEAIGQSNNLKIDSENYIRRMLTMGLGEQRAGSVIDRVFASKGSQTLEALNWMDSAAIANMLASEHPQLAAIVLACLEAEQSGDVLASLPEAMRGDVIVRIATLESIPAQAIEEIELLMSRPHSNAPRKTAPIGGAQAAAGILNQLDTEVEQELMGKLKEFSEPLGTKVSDLMLVFDNLADMDDKSIQAILREIGGDKLGLALRGADPAVNDKITKNMSKRAAEMLLEDMEARGPVRLSDVEGAQREILAVVRRLMESGVLQSGSKGESFV